MATESAQPSLRDIGHRRLILLAGALWGAVPALTFGVGALGDANPDQAMLAAGAAMTVTLAALFELDSRALAEHGTGVELAWSYALLAPISVVAFQFIGPALLLIPGLGVLGVLVGPPAAALVYVWQRGREASVPR
ncbi:hypothetical protein [Halobacterium jilantaiense]|uniref:Uncharacterized protein n=1 Tax=Halobacterium jilantaiense TaxID=355548 RepID=A0A1I0N5G8_9EURY|nr:hypothetical protein [Halobacterium jilantaiense]SEV96107.1 hypothetical protein SAMN04487945_0608 [Halobacterium jilantaiense]